MNPFTVTTLPGMNATTDIAVDLIDLFICFVALVALFAIAAWLDAGAVADALTEETVKPEVAESEGDQ